MGRKNFTPEQIIGKLREAEVLLSKGEPTPSACRAIGVSENTYYRWRKMYGGMQVNRAKKMKGQRPGTEGRFTETANTPFPCPRRKARRKWPETWDTVAGGCRT
jgi:transposase-like protein